MSKINSLKQLYELIKKEVSNFTIEVDFYVIEKNIISFKNLTDIGEIFNLEIRDIEKKDSSYLIRYQKLNSIDERYEKTSEKYGINSPLFNISKIYEPYFYHSFKTIVKEIKFPEKLKVLDLGINKGDEFTLLKDLNLNIELMVGLDHSKSALEYAKKIHRDCEFINFDLNKIESLNLNHKFNLLLSIGTLQSSGFDGKKVMRSVFQNHLEKESVIILGFPNCRYVERRVKYGAKVKNFGEHDLSLINKDISFYKKYFQQHKKRVRILGKYYLFVVAW
ncbi:MAG: methyltransferase [Candidatus Cloacimonadota bacterium]|nr:MAG: methyltransferase [Candidatus Cloacimonadota bacterium]PIE79948.1 MAG: methyltransferase [Candidatus Delongbacteria bacterium]